jgi:hypothetical protein
LTARVKGSRCLIVIPRQNVAKNKSGWAKKAQPEPTRISGRGTDR